VEQLGARSGTDGRLGGDEAAVRIWQI
jgi:hypothetical protein